MHIKKGDKVQVISGEYKGHVGEVIKAFPKENRVIVDVQTFKLNTKKQDKWVKKVEDLKEKEKSQHQKFYYTQKA